MRSIIHYGLWFLFIVAGILVLELLSAWASVNGTPRQATFWCSTHGSIPMSEAIRVLAAPMDEPVCPRCFHGVMKKAERSAR